MTFAARLAEILEDRGKTKSDIARHLGIEPQSVGQWGKGVKPTSPRGKRLSLLADFLDVTVPQLMAPPGAPFRNRRLHGPAESSAGVDPSLGDFIESSSKAAIVGSWDQLPKEDQDIILRVINGLRIQRGLPPIAI